MFITLNGLKFRKTKCKKSEESIEDLQIVFLKNAFISFSQIYHHNSQFSSFQMSQDTVYFRFCLYLS